jgi:hypothetical protein
MKTLILQVLYNRLASRFDGLFPIEVAKGLSQLGLREDFNFFWWESALRLILYCYIKERFIYFFPLTIFSKCIAFHSYWVCIHWNEMYKPKCNRCASVFIHRKWNIQNEVPSGEFFSVHSPEMKCTKPSCRCLHLRRNMLGKKHYLFLHKDFWSVKKTFPIYV